ncbi:MAG: VOC family protein, partial [Actinobacteria bacterium]|nr:VOC family protein [Actinomycetota bacterium]
MSGKLVHFELPARDVDRAKSFWSALCGWSFSEPMGMQYFMVRTGEDQGGAVFPGDGKGPIVYFDTDDIDAAIARAREHGGKADDKQPIPGVGWFARCSDTEGNDFSLFQSD